MTVSPSPFQPILGIRFFTGDLDGALALCPGNFVVVPSAPTLVELPVDPAYREAVENADFAITDSGYMVLLWRLFTGQKLIRLSGLKLLRGLLAGTALRAPAASFWVMPSAKELEINLGWLKREGYAVTEADTYVAPLYPAGPLTDADLLARIEARRPAYVILNIGGGVQERLGYYLRKNLSYRPSIICVGAAIAFITGLQANIPPWADRLIIGWLLRCVEAPAKFIPRYRRAMKLAVILGRYRERSVTAS
jgi:UDP-N-acetyl-D-mannosaminuronic acid transferase (WecB/TagA/CpsF family)